MKKIIYLLLSVLFSNLFAASCTGGFKVDLPAPPTNLNAIRDYEGTVVSLRWKDNSSNEDGFIIKRTLHEDTTTFIKIRSVPPNTTEFIVVALRPDKKYYFQVSAFNRSGESGPIQTTPEIFGRLIPPEELEVIPKYQSILITWKDKNENEDGFVLKRDSKIIAGVSKLATNTRYYVDDKLDTARTYTYVVQASKDNKLSKPSKIVSAKPLATNPIVEHSNGFEVDNLGGGAGGWSKFKTLGYDQLFDGHLQLWTGGEIVYDGDDGDFTNLTPIVLNSCSKGMDYEYTSDSPGSNKPVILKCKGESIEVQQKSYRKRDGNWILIDWTVQNTGKTGKYIKLALFLDADAGGELSVRDYGGFDETKNLVYIKNENQNMFVGMAIVSDDSHFENYQICNYFDPFTPDNSNIIHDGEKARKELLSGTEGYAGMHHGTKADDPTDLTMTLISNLGMIAPGNSNRVCYAISAETSLARLQKAIVQARNFRQSIIFEENE